MVAITCALFDEAYELIRFLKKEKIEGIPQYTGFLDGFPVSLYLTKPGFRKKKKFLRWLDSQPFQGLIQTGFAGALHKNMSLGDICHINRISMFQTKKRFFTSKSEKFSLCTSPHIAIEQDEKENIRYDSKADLVDMEAWHILNLLEKKNLPVHVVKIVGDLPGEKDFLKKEALVRSYFSSFSILEKCRIILKTKISFFSLYKRKRFLQRQLVRGVTEALQKL